MINRADLGRAAHLFDEIEQLTNFLATNDDYMRITVMPFMSAIRSTSITANKGDDLYVAVRNKAESDLAKARAMLIEIGADPDSVTTAA